MSVRGALEEAGAYLDIEDMARPLKLMYDSLLSTGDESVANARLLDLLRQVGGEGCPRGVLMKPPHA